MYYRIQTHGLLQGLPDHTQNILQYIQGHTAVSWILWRSLGSLFRSNCSPRGREPTSRPHSWHSNKMGATGGPDSPQLEELIPGGLDTHHTPWHIGYNQQQTRWVSGEHVPLLWAGLDLALQSFAKNSFSKSLARITLLVTSHISFWSDSCHSTKSELV